MKRSDYRKMLSDLELTDVKRYAELDAIADEINAFAELASDYHLSDESPLAEYVSTFGYGGECMHEIEDAIRRENFDAPVERWLKERLNKKRLSEIIDACTLKQVGIYRVDNELMSATIGEAQEQMPDELAAKWHALTDDEREMVKTRVDEYVDGDSVYINHSYERWVMVLNVDDLELDLDLAEVKAAGVERGKSIASYVDTPQIGQRVERHIDWCGLGQTIKDADDARKYFLMLCSEAESNDRSYTPFEFTAAEYNKAANADEVWTAFDEGISEGFESEANARDFKISEENEDNN